MEFEDLLIHCADRAYNFAFRLAGNDADAQDLVQEAFARAFEHRDRYDPSRPIEAWVNRILHNVFLDSVRRYEHKHKISLDAHLTSNDDEGSWEAVLPGKDEDPVHRLMKDEEEQLLQRAIDALPPHYKSAVLMSDIEEIPYDKIAKIMGVPIGTVCSRIHQGRVLLRKYLMGPKKPKKVTEHA